METICGIHAVQEAIESGRPIQHVHFQRGLHNQRLLRLMESCRQRDISLRLEPEAALERLARGAHHQGVVAVVGGHGYAELGEVLQRNPNDALLLLLDGVQDPRNLGALIRTACAAGVQAVVIPERRSAGLSPVVVQAASGAVEHLPVVRVTNLAQTMETLKKQSFWIYGLDERGEKNYDEVDYRGRCALVVGGEEKGIHHLLKSKCDGLVRIPAPGQIATLNVSVAAGIVLFEAAKQRKD